MGGGEKTASLADCADVSRRWVGGAEADDTVVTGHHTRGPQRCVEIIDHILKESVFTAHGSRLVDHEDDVCRVGRHGVGAFRVDT